jgi:hypothetical protein
LGGKVQKEHMKSVIPKLMLVFLCSFATFTHYVTAQGTFQNLDFEQANPVKGTPAPFYTAASCFQGWTCYLGQTPVTLVTYDAEALGDANISLMGPNDLYGPPALQGQYMVDLQAGANPNTAPFGYETASISQTGFVPSDASSLQFIAVGGPPTLSLGEDSLTMFPLSSGSTGWGYGGNYTIYGVNVAPFAGTVETLTITESTGGNHFFDSFQFSTSSVPEPSISALIFFGGAIMYLKVFRACLKTNV